MFLFVWLKNQWQRIYRRFRPIDNGAGPHETRWPSLRFIGVACNYSGDLQLHGPILDAQSLQRVVAETKVYHLESSSLLTDQVPGLELRDVFRSRLLKGPGADIAIVYFSGHGTQAPSDQVAERDGLDEGLLISAKTFIADDSFTATMRASSELHGTTLIFLDCCHSGGLCDLPFELDADAWRRTSHSIPQESTGGLILALAACWPQELAYESTGQEETRGIFTRALEQYLPSSLHGKSSLKTLLAQIQRSIAEELQPYGLVQSISLRASRPVDLQQSLRQCSAARSTGSCEA